MLILLLWLNGIFYGFAAAAQNLNENEVEKKAFGGDKNQGCFFPYWRDLPVRQRHTADRNRLRYVLWYFCGAVGCAGIPPLHKTSSRSLLAASAGVILLASLGILTFRRVGTYHPKKICLPLPACDPFFVTMLYPLPWLSPGSPGLAACISGVELNQTQDEVTEEEIISIVDEAHEQGVIEQNEAEMIQNIISFNETEARDIMTHRKNVVAFEEEILLQEMVDAMLEEGNSRYPVYAGNIDNVVGLYTIKTP